MTGSSLLENNPFLGPNTPKPAAEQNQSIEWCGVVVEGNVTWFIFHDTAANKWATVREGEKDAPFVVRSYDRAKGTVVLDVGGRKMALATKSAAGRSIGRFSSAAAERRFEAKPEVVVPAPSREEARRLEQVATVIRARREELRRQTDAPSPKRS